MHQTLFIQTVDSYQIYTVIYIPFPRSNGALSIFSTDVYLMYIWTDLLIPLMHLFKINSISFLLLLLAKFATLLFFCKKLWKAKRLTRCYNRNVIISTKKMTNTQYGMNHAIKITNCVIWSDTEIVVCTCLNVQHKPFSETKGFNIRMLMQTGRIWRLESRFIKWFSQIQLALISNTSLFLFFFPDDNSQHGWVRLHEGYEDIEICGYDITLLLTRTDIHGYWTNIIK